MGTKYKAILYEEPQICDFSFITIAKQNELNKPKPIDSTLLDKKCFKTAENIFYNKKGWTRSDRMHIEFESMPRILA